MVKRVLRKGLERELPADFDIDTHFTPTYDPWDQRLCVVPDNDIFKTLKTGKGEIVTDTIEAFTPAGIALKSGQHLEADIIVVATGLVLQAYGGARIYVDGREFINGEAHIYRGAMLSNLPNYAAAIGYTNASWTLKVDLVSHFVTRLLNHMHRKGYKVCTPVFDSNRFRTEPLLDFDSGYIQRGKHVMPVQGSKTPWKIHQNYFKDLFLIKRGSLTDGFLQYR